MVATLHRPGAVPVPTEAAGTQPASLCATREDLALGPPPIGIVYLDGRSSLSQKTVTQVKM